MKRLSQNTPTGLKTIKSLSTFRLLPSETTPIYHDAAVLPQFLQTNLKSEHRIVKQFEGEDAILKAFYFNIMKLAFEIECEEQNYVSIVRKILLSEQQFGRGELEDQSLSDSQYRNFLSEFMDILQSQEIPSFEETIQWYPIIDEILLKMFRRLVPITLKLKDSSDLQIAKRIFQYLCNKFKIKMQIISGCFKFIESDIFIYMNNIKQIYLIFVDQLAFIKEVTEEHSGISSKLSQPSQQSKSESSCVINYEIKHEKTSKENRKSEEASSKSKSISRDHHRPFNTVINMLQTKHSGINRSQLSASLHNRNSFENQFQHIPKNIPDKIKEKQSNLLQEYYAEETASRKFDQQISSLSTIKGKKTFSSSSSFLAQQKIDSHRNLVHTQRTEQMPLNQSEIQQNDSKLIKRHQQTCIELKPTIQSEQKKPLFKFPHRKQAERSKVNVDAKPVIDSRLKPKEQYQRQFSSSGNSKNSNLSLFSKVKGKLPAENEVRAEKNEVRAEKNEVTAEKNDLADTSYEKFTDSGLLQMLDEEYKEKIREIKKKYREQRATLKKCI